MLKELDVVVLVRDLRIVLFFCEPTCGDESLPTRTILIVIDIELWSLSLPISTDYTSI